MIHELFDVLNTESTSSYMEAFSFIHFCFSPRKCQDLFILGEKLPRSDLCDKLMWLTYSVSNFSV